MVTDLSFARDIRPMFTELDVEHMKPIAGDLSKWEDVKSNSDAIYEVVASGKMPPPASGEPRWTPEMCERFKRWQNQGCPP
jgi:hypothetical protein